MQKKIPHFSYHTKWNTQDIVCSIEANGDVIHNVSSFDDMDVFYRVFGYTEDAAKKGILPEEFVWSEYIRDGAGKFSDCVQMHLIEYLNLHSAKFKSLHGDDCSKWMLDHAEARKAKGELCIACKIEPICSKL